MRFGDTTIDTAERKRINERAKKRQKILTRDKNQPENKSEEERTNERGD